MPGNVAFDYERALLEVVVKAVSEATMSANRLSTRPRTL